MTTKSFLQKISQNSRKILDQMLFNSDNLAGVVSLTVLNSQCKKNNIKIHGYYLATAIECLMQCARLSSNREYYNTLYGSDNIDNMFNELVGWIYWSVNQNIETLRTTTNAPAPDAKLISMANDYCLQYIHNILKKEEFASELPMQRTDLFNYKFSSPRYLEEYQKKHRIDKNILKRNIDMKYGATVLLGVTLGWLLGCGNRDNLYTMERMGRDIGIFLKMAEDLTSIERDIMAPNNNLNYVLNCGIKEAYIEFMEAKNRFVEMMMMMDIDSKTIRDILDTVMARVDDKTSDISVDMRTQYEDCTSKSQKN